MGGKNKSQTIGYWYKLMYHMGIGVGPIDAFLEFRGGDKTAWSGELNDSADIEVSKPNLWGGEKDQGGIMGALRVMFGAADQMPSAYFKARVGPMVPAWRGLTTVIFSGAYGANNPYPQKASYKIRKIKAGWDEECWYPEKAEVYVAIGGEMAENSDGWEYIKLPYHANPGRANLDIPTDGWQPAGAGPFDDNNKWTRSPDLSVFWIRKTVSIRGSGLVLRAGADNGCVLFVNGDMIGASNPDNADIPNNDRFPVEYAIPAAGQYQIVVKAYTESTSASQAGNYLSVSARSQGLLGMNPAHVLYYARTHREIGREPIANLNDASYRAAADRLYSEGFGICTEYDPSVESVEEFEQRVCKLIGGSVSRSLIDGQYYLDLARGDYVLADLPIISDDDIIDFKLQPSAFDGAVNSVSVRYFDPDRKEAISTAPAQVLALIDAFGTIHQENEYLEIATAELASRLAERDVRLTATPTRAQELVVIPDAVRAIRPNQYFRLQSPKRRIADMVCLLGEKQSGTLRSGGMKIVASEDTYSLPSAAFVEVEAGVDTRPDQTPHAILLQAAFEAPYTELVQRLDRVNLAALPPDAGYLLAVASEPAKGGRNYDLTIAGSGGSFEVGSTGEWAPVAVVAGDPFKDVVLPSAKVISVSTLRLAGQIAIGSAAIWDAEIVRIDAIDAETKTITVGRGCADTVAVPHAAGSNIWFYDTSGASDLFEYTSGEVVEVKLLTNSNTAQLALEDAATMEVEMAGRAARPYPPAAPVLNGVSFPALIFETADVTWAHRDRVAQADQLFDQTVASIGPELDTKYNVRWFVNGTLMHSVSVSGTGASYAPTADGSLRVEIEAERGGLVSYQMQAIECDYRVTTFQNYADQAGDFYADAADETYYG